MDRLNEAVAEHKPQVEAIAIRLDGVGGAEYDDLVQEGLIKVWLLLRDYGEIEPKVLRASIRNAMLDWVRICRRQGFGSSTYGGYVELLDEGA